MAQVSSVIQGDPWKLASDLNTLAASNFIQIISKTYSSGKFIVVRDNAGTAGQTAVVVSGDPDYVKTQIDAFIALGRSIEIVTQTFSSAYYVVVYS
jgi:hypothetical protein